MECLPANKCGVTKQSENQKDSTWAFLKGRELGHVKGETEELAV